MWTLQTIKEVYLLHQYKNYYHLFAFKAMNLKLSREEMNHFGVFIHHESLKFALPFGALVISKCGWQLVQMALG